MSEISPGSEGAVASQRDIQNRRVEAAYNAAEGDVSKVRQNLEGSDIPGPVVEQKLQNIRNDEIDNR